MAAMLTPNGTKGYKGLPMEGFIARWYARNTATRDHRQTAELVARRVAEGGSILEVAPGPGYLAIELAKLGRFHVSGLDISRSFVEIATANARDAGVEVAFHHGDAAHMPFPEDAFDFIICQAAFKNFSQPVRVLGEMHRVLKPGGNSLIVDLRPDASPPAINAEVRKMKLSWLSALMTRMVFKYSLVKRAYTPEQFRQMTGESPFRTCDIQLDGIGLAVLLGK
jgi:ubiquinone/menaquinone biosynthesis C-methylase UbiE